MVFIQHVINRRRCVVFVILMLCYDLPYIRDVTVVSPLTASYVDKAATNAGTVADC